MANSPRWMLAARALVYLKRITLALERAYPPARPRPGPAEFSIATTADFEAGYRDSHPFDEEGAPQ